MKIHFVGIGGISMSALAKLMLLWGHKVSGSDKVYSKNAIELVEWGAKVYLGCDRQAIDESDLVVYTASILDADEELTYAKSIGKMMMSRECFLRELSLEYDITVAVSGSHGKTTVTSMLSDIFFEAGLNYTAHIGGHSSKGNMVYRGRDIFLTEACEYNRSFLSLNPDVALVLNTDFDHPDTYKNLGEINKAFCSFCNLVKRGGTIVVNKDSEFYDIIKCTHKNMCTYSIESSATFQATNIINYANGYYGFQIMESGYPNMDIKLKVAGLHNVSNALGAYATAVKCGVDRVVIRRALESFKGVRGRMELLGERGGAKVMRDYAHHPTEIRSLLKVAREQCYGRLIVVFQPHTMLRTEALLDEFKDVLMGADKVFLLKEYTARVESGGKSAFDLYDMLRGNMECYYYATPLELYSAIIPTLKVGDMVLLTGAGDIQESYNLLLN